MVCPVWSPGTLVLTPAIDTPTHPKFLCSRHFWCWTRWSEKIFKISKFSNYLGIKSESCQCSTFTMLDVLKRVLHFPISRQIIASRVFARLFDLVKYRYSKSKERFDSVGNYWGLSKSYCWLMFENGKTTPMQIERFIVNLKRFRSKIFGDSSKWIENFFI